jgi:RNA polymerase sigma-70 factor (ECF subfamily)
VVIAATRNTTAASAAAMETICRSYWYPLYAYARRCGQSPHDAQDLTQEFFCRLLEKRWLDSVDPSKGRLRTFLILAMKRFMAKDWRRAIAQRRGGGQLHVPLDTTLAESRYDSGVDAHLAAEQVFDRQWALALIEITLDRLKAEFVAAGKPEEFEMLKRTLMAERGAIDYAAIAHQLKASEGAARVAVHRLRKRFRELYREEISQTLTDGTDLDAELRHLAQALAH